MKILSPSFMMFYWFGGMVALSLLSFWASPYKSWQTRGGDRTIIFRPPPFSRLFLALSGLWIALSPLLFVAAFVTDAKGWMLFSIIELVSTCAGGVLCLSAAGFRNELRLDMERRIYRFTYDWAIRPRVWSGSMADMASVFVRWQPMHHGELCTVGVAWNNGVIIAPTLGRFRSEQRAETLAEEMMNILGMPRVAAPTPETLRDVFRRN